jgi:hypothetical protein
MEQCPAMLEHYSTEHGITPASLWLPPLLDFSLPSNTYGLGSIFNPTPGLSWKIEFCDFPDSITFQWFVAMDEDIKMLSQPFNQLLIGHQISMVLVDQASRAILASNVEGMKEVRDMGNWVVGDRLALYMTITDKKVVPGRRLDDFDQAEGINNLLKKKNEEKMRGRRRSTMGRA